MAHPESAPLASSADSPPDWSTLTERIDCPLCRYDLRGLIDPRCPECGYTFTWPGLFEARRTTHPYLFEHHPERNARSFLRTSLATFLPRRFWRSLAAAHAARPRRLLLYWLLTCLPLATLLTAIVTLHAWNDHDRSLFRASQFLTYFSSATPGTQAYDARQDLIRKFGSLQAYVDLVTPVPTYPAALLGAANHFRPFLVTFALWLAWPFATAAALLAYRHSMRQAAISPSHVFRCALYSADLLWWPGLALLGHLAWLYGSYAKAAYISGQSPLSVFYFMYPYSLILWALYAWHAAVLLATYRLTVAYARYLRFPRAWIAVPLASIASLLALWILYLALAGPIGLVLLAR